jgi:hypothetical protein
LHSGENPSQYAIGASAGVAPVGSGVRAVFNIIEIISRSRREIQDEPARNGRSRTG